MVGIRLLPAAVGLETFQLQVEGGHVRAEVAALVELAAVVVLIGGLPFERAARGKGVARVEFGHLVHHFLVGVVDLARPRIDFRRTADANAFAQQLFVAHLRTEQYADAGGEEAVIGIGFKAIAFPTEGHRAVGFAQAGVVEQIACRGTVAAVDVRALHAPCRTAARQGQTRVGRSGQGEASAVAAVERRDVALGLRTHIGEGFAVELDHPAEGFRTVAHGLCAFHHIDAAGGVGVEFGRVIHAPLLSLLAHAVVHDEQARAIHAVEHGFGNGGAGLHHAHSFDLFEGGGKGTAEIFLHFGGREGLCGGVARMDDASGLHHGLVEAVGQGGERHAQGAMAAHFVGGDAAVDITHRTHREAVAVEGFLVEHEQTGGVGAPQLAAAAHHGARNGETGVAIGDEQARRTHRLGFGGAQAGGNDRGGAEKKAGNKNLGHANKGYNGQEAPQWSSHCGAVGEGVPGWGVFVRREAAGGYCPGPDCVVQGAWGEDISAFPVDEGERARGRRAQRFHRRQKNHAPPSAVRSLRWRAERTKGGLCELPPTSRFFQYAGYSTGEYGVQPDSSDRQKAGVRAMKPCDISSAGRFAQKGERSESTLRTHAAETGER